ncbi:MAG: HRDC domain-containing protein [Anaerolineae bacterium]|nr:HRDC domain-containing protein [Anaerolineae bacterium]
MTKQAHPALPKPILARTSAQLREVMAQLRSELEHAPLLAVDTEANSMYAYREQVCLIQLSTRLTDYIIDPIAGFDVAPLGELFADQNIEKVFHAAEYDLICMKRDFHFTFTNLFDTMIAARVVGMKNFGLGSLLEELMQIEVDKSHQRDDWGQRPLPKDSLLYAQHDTHYLPALRDYFAERLTEMSRWEDARETFEDLSHINGVVRTFDPESYWKLAVPNHLTRRQTAILRELFLLREQIAKDRNTPPFKVMQDKPLIALAQAAPESLAEMERVNGVSYSATRRYGLAMLEAIENGKAARVPSPPRPEPPTDPVQVECYTALREWRKTRAADRGVESDVIVSRETLWTIAERRPKTLDEMGSIRGLGEWRLAQYGEEILMVTKRFKG